MAKKNGVTVSVGSVVCVEISGRKPKGSSGVPTVREDDNLTSEFLRWSLDNDVFGSVIAGHASPGSYLGFFDEKDAQRVKDWFRRKGFKDI